MKLTQSQYWMLLSSIWLGIATTTPHLMLQLAGAVIVALGVLNIIFAEGRD